MAWELSITSAPRGLKPGSAGFCPVAHTRTMPPVLIKPLESISGYRHLEIGTRASERNPVVRSHTILRLGGETYHVLSRICDAGRDYSGRSNRFAYHLVLRPQELPPAGPAVLLRTPGLLREQWDGQVCLIPQEKEVPKITWQCKPCTAWERAWGDAGWAGVLVQKFLNDSQKNIYFVYPADVDILKLFEEAIALLPESLRWKVTFSTFDQGPEVFPCRWHAVPAHVPEVSEILNRRGLEVWDLRGKRGPAPASPEVLAAREGRPIELPPPQTISASLPEAPAPRPTASPAGFAANVPAPPKDDIPFLRVVDDRETPPPIRVASTRILTPRKRKTPLSLLINLAMLFVGLVVGLGIGFVLWSGRFMPPLLSVSEGQLRNIKEETTIEKVPQQDVAEKRDPGEKGKLPTVKAQTAEQPQPKKEEAGQSSEKPPASSVVESHQKEQSPAPDGKNKGNAQAPPPPSDKAPQQGAASSGGKNSASQAVPGPHESEGAKNEVVAIPLSDLTILQIAELVHEATAKTVLPGGQTVVSWRSKPIWSLEKWQENKEIAILKVIDRSGRPSYYVASVKPIDTVELKLGQERTLEISPIQGIKFELRGVNGWKKGTPGNEYRFRSDGKEYVRLRLEQKPAKLTVKAEPLGGQGADHKLPDEIAAEIGFYLTDETGTRIWISRIKLRIITGQAGTADSGER